MSSKKYEALPSEIKEQIAWFDSKFCNQELFVIEYDNCEVYSDSFSYVLDVYFNSYQRAVEYILEIGDYEFKPEIRTYRDLESGWISFNAKLDDWDECEYSVNILKPA